MASYDSPETHNAVNGGAARAADWHSAGDENTDVDPGVGQLFSLNASGFSHVGTEYYDATERR